VRAHLVIASVLTLLICTTGLASAPVGWQPNDSQRAAADSTRALLRRIQDALNSRDLAKVMATYPNGPTVTSAAFGELLRQRAAIEANMRDFFAHTEKVHIRFTDPVIDIISSDASAVTTRYVLEITPRGEASSSSCGVWSGVLALRGGRFVILQEHQSAQSHACSRSA